MIELSKSVFNIKFYSPVSISRLKIQFLSIFEKWWQHSKTFPYLAGTLEIIFVKKISKLVITYLRYSLTYDRLLDIKIFVEIINFSQGPKCIKSFELINTKTTEKVFDYLTPISFWTVPVNFKKKSLILRVLIRLSGWNIALSSDLVCRNSS